MSPYIVKKGYIVKLSYIVREWRLDNVEPRQGKGSTLSSGYIVEMGGLTM